MMTLSLLGVGNGISVFGMIKGWREEEEGWVEMRG